MGFENVSVALGSVCAFTGAKIFGLVDGEYFWSKTTLYGVRCKVYGKQLYLRTLTRLLKIWIKCFSICIVNKNLAVKLVYKDKKITTNRSVES